MPKIVQQKNVTKNSGESTQPQPKLIVGLRKSAANTQGNNPKDRYGLAKVPFSLIPQSAKVLMAMALGIGAKKYGPYNWRVEPVQGRVYLEAAERHLNLLLDGEDFDRDTGLHHGAFVLSTIAIYIDALTQGTLIDNRPLPGHTGDLVAFFNRTPNQERTKEELVEGFKQLLPTQDRITVEVGDEIALDVGPEQDTHSAYDTFHTELYKEVAKIPWVSAEPTTKRAPAKRSTKKGKRNARR